MSRKKRQQIRHDALARVRRYVTGRPGEDFGMRRVRKQCEKYEAKLRRGEGNARADRNTKAQVERYVRAAELAAEREMAIRQVVHDAGVPQCLVFSYLSYARHVQKLKREFTGRSLQARVDAAAERWGLRGLDPQMLRTVSETVCGV